MIFSSAGFILAFLPLVLLGAVLLRRIRGGTTALLVWLTMASLFFYGFWRAEYLVLICVSILVNWAFGIWIRKCAETSRVPLFIGIVFNLLLIGFFKYFDFLIGNVNAFTGAGFSSWEIILPLGISFFTFQQIAYLVDTSKGLTGSTGLLEYSFFVSFFPQLIAGPIVHHRHILPSVRVGRAFAIDAEGVLKGLHAFSIGFAKKVIIADSLAIAASGIFDSADAGHAISTHDAILGTLSYTFQIYFDFSGYTDMAIGLGLMFGIQLPKNFDSPYKATSIIDFWRRWHITLSEFLRDYVYIPLGGNRKGLRRRHFNLLSTMLIGGMWHGASWPFVCWGALHGVFLVINHGLRRIIPRMEGEGRRLVISIPGFVFTFVFVALAWVPFRAVTWSGMMHVYQGIFPFLGGGPIDPERAFDPGLASYPVEFTIDSMDLTAWALVVVAGVISFLFPNTWTLLERFSSKRGIHRFGSNTLTVSAFVLAMFVLLYHANRVTEFIYFNF